MLTLFATPKPFRGHIGVIQRNAITSWTRLEPRPEILLFGDEEGTAEVCASLGPRHVPDVDRSEFGTPLISGIFREAQRIAGSDWLCYVNSDIILLDDFVPATERLARLGRPVLGVGQRWELDVREPIDFGRAEWAAELRRRQRRDGRLAGLRAIDYFVFRRGFYDGIPDFVAGRNGFDWWLIHAALERGARVVDVTPAVTAIHQSHEQAGHLAPHIHEAETRHNESLYQVPWTNLYDATHLLTSRGLRRAWWRRLAKPVWVFRNRHGYLIRNFPRIAWTKAREMISA